MMPPSQAHRIVAVGTPLGPDVLLLRSMKGNERLSHPFEYQLELLATDHELKFEEIVGENVTIRLELSDGETRYFNGFVSRFSQVGSEDEYARYEATVVPWLWFLTRTADCRIFQEKTVPEIIAEVCKDRGFTDFDDRLSGSYRTWEYCVQYRESDFAFVSRLMEQEGIYYYFEHENGKHTMVLVDSSSIHQPAAGYEEIPYRPEGTSAGVESIVSWVVRNEVQAGAYETKDYNFKQPRKDLLARQQMPPEPRHAMCDFSVFDYPGEYTEIQEGDDYARVRMEQMRCQFELAFGDTTARGISPGFTFKLTECPRGDQNRRYLITAVEYLLESDMFRSADAGSDYEPFRCRFTAMPDDIQYRHPRATAKPTIRGPQTATVVGKSGEEIWTDKHGRVKVQFHWDRYGKANENSSCWIRVSQAWAGKQWGAMYLPRIGQEVIVEFLEGDPDRPIITGRVYNGDNMPPYELPGEATKSTIKSNSSKGGGGFNEIRFEDKKGEEQIFIHAEKNQDIRVKNDTYEWIGNERHLIVKKNQIELVEENLSEKVNGNQATEVGGTLSLAVKGDVAEAYDSDHSEVTKGDVYIKGTNIVIEGTTNVTIKVGQSFIAIEAGGITVSTPAKLELLGEGQVEMKGAIVKVEGSGMTEIKGGLVKIN